MSGLSKAVRPMTFSQVRWIRPLRRGGAGADPRVTTIYAEMERVFGVISPPIALHSPAPDTLAAAWMLLYETLLVPGRIDRAAKEAIATAVSVANECPYCVTVHSTMMGTLDHKQAASALAADSAAQVADPVVRALGAWARGSVRADTAAAQMPPFPAAHAAEAVGIVLQFHYINRMVNVFLGDAPLPDFAPRAAMRVVRPMLSRLMHAGYQNEAAAGRSLELLPEAPLAPALWWARSDPYIEQAVARADAATEAAGRRSVPRNVRTLVLAELAGWEGQQKGPSRAWVEQAVRELPEVERAAGRLALLIALASYQVDATVIEAFRARQPSDAALVELAAWASMAAAVRATSWTVRQGDLDVRQEVEL
jgi:AhpD family alkylhydroperoxidase